MQTANAEATRVTSETKNAQSPMASIPTKTQNVNSDGGETPGAYLSAAHGQYHRPTDGQKQLQDRVHSGGQQYQQGDTAGLLGAGQQQGQERGISFSLQSDFWSRTKRLRGMEVCSSALL